MFKGVSAVPTLARRFLMAKTSDGFVSLIAWVSVVGVALGVLALVVVTSVINGFEGELIRVITGMNGDVVLYSKGESVSGPAAIEAKIRQVVPETQAITASLVAELMSSGPSGVAGTILEGIDPATIEKVTEVKKRVVSGRLPQGDGEIALTYALADRLGAKEGSEIRLIAPFTGEQTKDGVSVPKVVKVQVVGIVRMGMYEYDSKFAFATLDSVQKFMNQPGKVSTFKLKLDPRVDSRKAADQLTDNFGYPFRARDWSQMNKNLFYAIRLEKVVIAIILTVIVIVAAFNVVSTLMMMIHDKTKEIAILKAMGFRATQSFQLFCLIGMGIGAVGTGVGVAIGLGINALLQKTHWIDLPAEIYYIGFLPVIVRWSEVGMIAFAALLITFAATLYPSIRVSTRSPLDGLRHD
ncbi:MAG: ABC transporter permease [Methylotenera sp.]|nr:ABC transporter permease [Oligoflexia bacterium]